MGGGTKPSTIPQREALFCATGDKKSVAQMYEWKDGCWLAGLPIEQPCKGTGASLGECGALWWDKAEDCPPGRGPLLGCRAPEVSLSGGING